MTLLENIAGITLDHRLRITYADANVSDDNGENVCYIRAANLIAINVNSYLCVRWTVLVAVLRPVRASRFITMVLVCFC